MNFMFSTPKHPKKTGFTLIELLVLMAVMGVLLLFSALASRQYFKRARDTDRKYDLHQIKIALYDYYFDQTCFPQELPDCHETLSVGQRKYLTDFPCDEITGSYSYQVEEGDCPKQFKLLTSLEDEQDLAIDKVECRDGCGQNCDYNYGIASSNTRLNEGCVVYFACSPNGNCIEFEDPDISQCPMVFNNDSSCQGMCENRDNRCHDNRGKK